MLPILLGCAPDPAPVPSALTPTVEDTTVRLGEHLTLEAEVRGEGTLDVALTLVDGLVVPTVTAGDGGATFEGLVLSGTWDLDGDAVLWRQGYQSWSWSGVLPIEAPAMEDGLPAVDGDGDTWTVAVETPATSWWAGMVGVDGGDALFLGVTAATRTKFWTAFGPEEAWAVWGMRGERVPLAPSETLTLDPLYVARGDESLWGEWAARVPGRPSATPPPVGWSDWYQYYGETSEDVLLAELAAAPAAVAVFQVDDGWERAWGDWRANDAFPGGTQGLAAAIVATGRTPGLWMAPLYVDTTTEVYAAHPDWWVRGEDGEPTIHGALLGMDLALLDVTHPDAAAWLASEIAAKVDEGWVYLKLDFLYAGAVEGDRYADVTGVEAYAEAMRIVRDAMGESWFLACGAPMLPSVGWADSWRSGADIAFTVHPDPDLAFLRWQARNTAARAFANGVWWWNDADAVLVRAPFDEGGARAALAAGVASGGVWFGGDGLPAGGDAAYDAALLALLGATPVPERPLAHVSGYDAGPLAELGDPDDVVPVRWAVGDATVLLNVGDDDVEVAAPGGLELLGGGAGEGAHTLPAGDAEVWVPG